MVYGLWNRVVFSRLILSGIVELFIVVCRCHIRDNINYFYMQQIYKGGGAVVVSERITNHLLNRI